MSVRPRLRLATANPDKVVEIQKVLEGLVEVSPRPPGVADVVEDGDTLEANARLKAAAIANATDEPAIADDTGLEVVALDGAPGVRSARYAGDDASYLDNVAKLLSELRSLGAESPEARAAQFRTVVLVRWPDGSEILTEGVCAGHVASAPRGSGTFGYDPVFVPSDGDGRTFAELTIDEKNAISHRGRAFRAMAAELDRVANR